MKKIAKVLSLLVVFALLLTACGGKKDEGTKDPGTSTTEKQELIINLGSEPPQLDSAKTTDSVSFDVLNQVIEPLIRRGNDGKLAPGIAEKWEVSPDGLTYTFNLRKGAKWSDGKEVTAQDFTYAWLRAMDPNTASEYGFITHYIKGAAEFNSLDVTAADFQAKYDEAKKNVAIETPDNYTIKVTVTAPTPFFLGMMSFPTYFPQREDIVNKFNTKEGDKIVEKFGAEAANMVYNGPFVIESWEHENQIILAKNANYWDAANSKLEKVTFRMISDTNTAIQMYETGELDRVGLSGANVAKYSNDPGFRTVPDLSTFWMVPNLSKNPVFQNVNFRKALSAAIDRKAFVEGVLKNGSLPATGAVPPGLGSGIDGKDFRSVTPSLISPTADKAKALEYWNKAKAELGVNEVTIKLMTDDGDLVKRMGEAIQAMVQEAMPGVKLELEQVTFQIRLDRTRKKDYEMVFAGWGPDYDYPTTFLDLWKSDSSFNDPGWKDAKYDQLLADAAKEADVVKAAEKLKEAETYLMDQLPIIPTYHRVVAGVGRPYVKNWKTYAIGAGFELKYVYIEGKGK